MNFKKYFDYLNLEALSLFLSLLAISGALVYYLYSLNTKGLIIVTLVTFISFGLLIKYLPKAKINTAKTGPAEDRTKENKRQRWLELFLVVTYLVLYLASIIILFSASSDRALVSPWELVPNYFWLVFFGLTISLILIITNHRFTKRSRIIFLSLHYLLSFSVAIIVYKINYGFDPFIHQATLELIAKNGSVAPKPFYYLGEYSLIIWFNKIFGLSIYWLNRLIVPVLAALFLPSTLFKWINYQTKNESGPDKNNLNLEDDSINSVRLLAILALLILPFSIFIMNTPQNLSYLFLILTIFTALSRDKNLLLPLILALATFCIHPLTGLAALGCLAFLLLYKYKNHLSKIQERLAKILIFLLLALSWPLAFYYSAANSFKINAFKLILNKIWLPSSFFPNQEKLFLNFSYFLYFNYPFLIALLIGASLYFYRKNILDSKDKRLQVLVISAAATLVAWFLSSLLSFSSLINYEQNNYPERLLIILVIFNIPFILKVFLGAGQKILISKKLDRLIWLFISATILSAALYSAYPRRDNYFDSHGYSVSRSDLEAVRLIAANSQSSYIVLANQQTSAAALKELGFNHYYKTNQGLIYFYPIPTGSALYQFYLDMVYKKPQRATMLKAMDLAGVNEAYFVINKYWKDSKKIIENAKLEADSFRVINQGEIYIFKYQR
ncbi:MAG: hypothetical protein NTX66_02500 [Candidatus Falkowbacteria bacterium]|nr:hypothetical protein [Candidatus Falkowbacteria bacterium]